ncbi:DUF6339 family protein [Kineococcus sp. SYSU DK018]|uniref:DUF6339 family protein n=1 Tax=Kineococcus sp. SYSU DK018 TaxID=3383139 RepID=UPI003D7E575B
MSKLYPRILPDESKRRFDFMLTADLEELEKAPAQSERAYYAASGGVRVRHDELAYLRQRLEQVAKENGYPNRPSTLQLNEFDRGVARLLHSGCDMAPGEASQRSVWAYLAMVLVPHLCVWRFPPPRGERLRAGKTGGAVDRYRGDDLTRHALARLWWRAHLLHESRRPDPYHLLPVLGEGAFDQIFARRTLAANAKLVRSIVRVEASSLSRDIATTDVIIDVAKRFLRMTAFIDLEWVDDAELDEIVRDQRRIAVESLSEIRNERRGQRSNEQNVRVLYGTVTVEATWSGTAASVDLIAVLVDDRRQVRNNADFVFYNQKSSADGSVQLLDASAAVPGHASKTLRLELSSVPSDVDAVVVLLSSDVGNLERVQELRLLVVSRAAGTSVERRVDERIPSSAAAVLALRREGLGWTSDVLSETFPEGLAEAARFHGVAVD